MGELEQSISQMIRLAEPFEALVERFIAANDLKPVSREGYKRRLRGFFRWCAERNVCQPTPETILIYKRSLQDRQATANTIGAYLSAVRSFFVWTESIRLYPNIAKQIRGVKKQKGFRRDPFTVEQVHTLLNSIEADFSLKGRRDRAIINLCLRTGLRSIEVSRCNVEDIRQESGATVLWVQGKGADAKDAFVVLTPAAYAPIQDYLALRGPTKAGEPLFGSTSDGNRHQRMATRSIRRIVKNRIRAIKLDSPRLSTHSCRHFAATAALLGGATIQETQALLRHSDVNTTLIYAQNLKRSAGIPEAKIDELIASYSARFPNEESGDEMREDDQSC